MRREIRVGPGLASVLAIALATPFADAAVNVTRVGLSPRVVARLGLASPLVPALVGGQPAARVAAQNAVVPGPDVAGLPSVLDPRAPLSTAVATTVGGLNSIFNEVDMMGDWDGREDLIADHARRIADLAPLFVNPGQTLTRVAVSEHTFANGFTENVFYYGDSWGNLYVGVDTDGDGLADKTLTLNLPTVLNAFGNLNSDNRIVITGIAVNPVADLGSFAHVNGSFSFFDGKVGEILVVAFTDTGGGFRLTSNNTLVRSGILTLPVADEVSPAVAPPGIQSDTGFPITVGGFFGVAFSVYSNIAGCAVDDDGSVYFQQVDLIGMSGGNIVEIASVDQPGDPVNMVPGYQDRSLATNGFMTMTTLNPTNGYYGTSSGPANQINRYTNYSGTSSLWGNVVGLACGPGNAVYAAVSRSWVTSDPPATQATEGLFPAEDATGPTPSMVISFADNSGATGVNDEPLADGIADPADGLPMLPGVNNFKAFVLGDGPDQRAMGSAVWGSPADTLKLAMQVDYTIYSGITVDEEQSVYVISGGTPAGVGANPSPNLGEILKFPDIAPYDRRADYVDLRGDDVPNGGNPGGPNLGDGDSDRYDHIFWLAPIDPVSLTPTGAAGLSRGFLLYLNRTRNVPSPNPTLAALPNGTVQGDDSDAGPLIFEDFDPSHQVAGGDDQMYPFRGDDSDGGGNPTIAGPLQGGFEFILDQQPAPESCAPETYNAFYLNSNGNLTFTIGDDSNIPDVASFLTGPPKVAGAWSDLNPSAHAAYPNTFSVQALGFANINHFKVRWIDVPLFGQELANSSNTLSISLFDDGTGVDENANQPLNPANPIGNNAVPFDLREGPTDVRSWWLSGLLVPLPPRPDGSGRIQFQYGRMDASGSSGEPVLVGYAMGDMPLGSMVAAVNLSQTGRSFAVGSGLEPAVFEFFHNDDYDLRFEGNDAAVRPPDQPDSNRGWLDLVGRSCGPEKPTALAVDPGGNGVLEPGETAVVRPTWLTTGPSSFDLTGVAADFTGPGPDPSVYSIVNPLAVYTNPNSMGTDCGDQCFSVSVAVPGSRPAQHWDAIFHEYLADGQVHTWTLHIGESFTDVPPSNIFYRFVETLFHNGVTSGCGAGEFCPDQPARRNQIAVLLLTAKEGRSYVPPACVAGSETFSDVPASDPFCPWIEELARRGITAGCGGGKYCPMDPVAREQAAVLVLATEEGSGYLPPSCIPGSERFADVPASSPFCPWVQEFANRGITAGCAPDLFCPLDSTSRGQTSVFLTAAFSLNLYAP
jgi:hypothetical protein